MLLEGARKPGAKILISGGGRCNVTNTVVTEATSGAAARRSCARFCARFPSSDTVAFFRELGVPLHEEADGKLFPDSNRARDVLDALLRAARRRRASRFSSIIACSDVTPSAQGFRIVTSRGDLHARAVVLATGGRSLPKTGSDGAGYEIAERLGHTIVPTTPALVPLVLAADAEPAHGSCPACRTTSS